MAKAKPRFNPNEAAAKMFLSTQEEQVTQNTQDVPSVHDTQKEQQTHDTHSTPNVQSTPNTQGTQRVQKHPRINMAFYGDNLEFVREAAWRNKQSITEYMNSLIEQARNK